MAAKILAGVAAVPVAALLIAASLGGDAGTDALPSGPFVTTAIPEPYRDLVDKAGQVCQEITSPLIAAQIDAESSWNPSATSPAGAQGLAQFIPAAWTTYGKDYNNNGRNSPLDPGDAIPAQARMMCDLAGQMKAAKSSGKVHGDVIDLALAGYNAGPGAVFDAGGIPPISETQAYVVRIKALTAKYTLTGGDGGAPGQQLPPQSCSVTDWTQPGKTQPGGAPACLEPRMDKLARALVAHGFGNGTKPGFYCWDWHSQNPGSDHRRGAACDLPYGPGFASGQNLADGTAAAHWIVAHAAEYGVRHVIWQGLVWTSWDPQWTPYDGGGVYDPADASGGHYDHVHVSVW